MKTDKDDEIHHEDHPALETVVGAGGEFLFDLGAATLERRPTDIESDI